MRKRYFVDIENPDNSGAEIRSAILKIQAGSRTQSLAVMQAAPTISLSADTWKSVLKELRVRLSCGRMLHGVSIKMPIG